MGCFKTLALNQAAAATIDMFTEAVYVPGIDKILAVSGPYVVKCNADTGARETAVRVASPVYGTMRIVYHAANAMVYVSTWACPANQNFTAWPKREVWPVDPTTMTVGAALGIDAFMGQPILSTQQAEAGPRWMVSEGNYIYLVYRNGSVAPLRRFNPTNTADRIVSGSATNTTGLWTEQGSSDGTYLYMCDASAQRLKQAILATTLQNDNCNLAPYTPISAVWCPTVSKPYATDGEGNMLRIDDIPTDSYTAFDLNDNGVVPGTLGTCDPVRIRYRSSDGHLYLACPTPNAVIDYNPNTDTGVIHSTGFNNPVDVVFTASKAFAVQDYSTGLKEIT